MQINTNLVAAVILSVPAVSGISAPLQPGTCYFGGSNGAGSCHFLDANKNPTNTYTDCLVSLCIVF